MPVVERPPEIAANRLPLAGMEAGGSVKGGYDCAFVSPPPKHLECPVCLLTVKEPHLTDCCGNHYYCRTCIESILGAGKPCPLCSQDGFRVFPHKGMKREVDELPVHCPQKELGCEWKGELRQLEDHVSQQGESGCGYVEVVCANGCGESLQRRLLAAHQTDECPMRPVEVQIASMMKMLQLQSAEIAQMKTVIDELTSAREQDSQQLSHLRSENRLLREEMLAKESRFTPVPPFLFTFSNYQHYKMNDMVYSSPSFYSHAGGYKFRIMIYPNGVYEGKGSHVSIFVAIVKGEYDDTLVWPFQGRVTLGLRKPWSSDVVHGMTVTYDDHAPKKCCSKPKHCVTMQYYGNSRYLSFEDISRFGDSQLRFVVSEVELFSQ